MERVTIQKILDSLQIDSTGGYYNQIDIIQILINLAAAFAVAMFIYWIYKITFSGVLYSKNLNITLVLVSLVTTSVVMIISSNIVLALGMVGALSIVRFRMAVKDPKDVGFLFWAITNGIICGISAYGLAVVSALFIGLVIFILSKRIKLYEPYLLILECNKENLPVIEKICKDYCSIYKIRSKTIRDNIFEIVLEIKIKDKALSEFLEKIRSVEGIESSRLISYEGDLEEG